MSFATEAKRVNTSLMLLKNDSNQTLAVLARKRIEFHKPQKRFPIAGGVIYYTMKSNNKLTFTVAYTVDEVGTSITESFDNMIKEVSATGEVPEKTFTLETSPQDGTTGKKFTQECKMTDLVIEGEGEGETIATVTLQIIDNNPTVTSM